MAANLMRTLDHERFEAGVISSLNSSFDEDLEESLAQGRTPVWHPVRRRGSDSRTCARFTGVLDCVGPHAGWELTLPPQGSTQRITSLDKHEGFR